MDTIGGRRDAEKQKRSNIFAKHRRAASNAEMPCQINGKGKKELKEKIKEFFFFLKSGVQRKT